MKKIPGLCCIVFSLLAASALAKFDPSFRWTTLETPHFLIHYHQGEEEMAQKAARVAEDIHARLVPRIRWEPKGKTNLVLVDSSDDANGQAFPIPYNWMIILAARPAGELGLGAVPCDDWLRTVITHEYTHVLQLDMVSGLPKTLQGVLGRIYFPNLFQPLWMIEGLATYEETEQTSGGRGRAATTDMILRMAVLEDRFPALGRATVSPDTWPSGQVPYLFGESFTRYVAEKYGREKLAEVSTAYSGRGFPFLVTSTGLRVLHERYDDLWDEWVGELGRRYRKQEAEIRARGLSPSTPLSRRGYWNVHPAFSPDGSRIAYTAANGDEFPGIYVIKADGGGDRKLVENAVTLSGAAVSWSQDGERLYYTKLEVQRNTNRYDDLYYYDFRKKKEVRLTRGLRARDPHPSPDGKRIVLVTNRLGSTRLAMMDISRPVDGKGIMYLTREGPVQYSAPRWSPDGTRIAVSVWQPGGYKDVRILDAQGNKIREISRDRALDGAPAWSPDGKYIYFSSDRTGVFNLYAYETETGKMFQVTNVLGGAFTPSPSPDGKTLAFSSYSAKGFDIHTLTVDPASWKPAEPYRDPYPPIQYEEKEVTTSTRPYSHLSTLYPHFWLPWLGYSQASGWMIGAFTYGQDVVQRHRYVATALYGPKSERAWYALNYFYDGLYPTLHFQASDADVTYGSLLADSRGIKDYVEREIAFGASVITPLVRTATQHSVSIGYRRREISHLTDLPPWPGYRGAVPAEGVLASGRIAYLYNSSRRYGFSISPEQGRTVEVGYERFDRSAGSDFEFNKYSADWHEYVNFPWKHHVLQARVFAGTSTGEVLPQRAFQMGGDNPGDITLSLDDRSVYLRGYPANAFRGQKAALMGLEYRFPVKNMEQGWDSKPVFVRRLHGAVFAEAGNAWDGTFHASDLKRSVGAEARLDLTLGYFLPVTLRLTLARGLDEGGESLVYWGLWVPLEL